MSEGQGLIHTHHLVAELAIVCTDRGQHKRTRLTTVQWWARNGESEPDQMAMSKIGRKFEIPDENPHGASLPYEFWCAGCRRNPQVSAKRFRALVDSARRAGLPEFDMSSLD